MNPHNKRIVAKIIQLRDEYNMSVRDIADSQWESWLQTAPEDRAEPSAIATAIHLTIEEKRKWYLRRIAALVDQLQAPTIEEDKVAPLIDAKLKTLGRAMRKSDLNKE